MKARIASTTSLPGGLVLEAESEAEVAFLRNFVNWPGQHANPQELYVVNHGGNISEGRYSMMVKWDSRREPLAPDTDLSDTHRAIHRVVRALNDGECPKCHTLNPCEIGFLQNLPAVPGNEAKWVCNYCGFEVAWKEAQEVMQLFALKMEGALALFERWREGSK